jgi:putative OPT family oligopeptide transporter
VIIPAFCFAPILSLMHHAYGIGTGEAGSLRAPQAALFASLTEGFFGDGGLPWDLILIGALIGLGLIFIDGALARAGSRFRAHIMPIAVGIYLPLSLDIPILIGGLIRHFLASARAGGAADDAHDRGVLFGSGLIAGEALMGILLAVPIWLMPDFLPEGEGHTWVSLPVFAAVILLYIRIARRTGR